LATHRTIRCLGLPKRAAIAKGVKEYGVMKVVLLALRFLLLGLAISLAACDDEGRFKDSVSQAEDEDEEREEAEEAEEDEDDDA
jgi:hypothetical protein